MSATITWQSQSAGHFRLATSSHFLYNIFKVLPPMFNPLKLLRQTPRRPEEFIALDFGTTSTKAFIFSLKEKVELKGQGQGTPEEAIEEATTQAGVRPSQAVVGIGGENAWCLTTTIRLNRPDPEKEIETKEIEKLNEQIFRTALMQATTQVSQFTGDLEPSLQLIDSETLSYKLDGKIYPPTNLPTGDIGKILECSIFTAYSPTTYLNWLRENLKELKLNLWAVCSLMSVLTKALANNNPRDFNAIILDVGGQITDIAVVFGGGIWGTRPLPLGGESLALDFWLSGVETALQDFEGVKTFPNRIILTGGANLSELKEGFLNYPLTRTLPFAAPPIVEVRTDVGPQSMKFIAKDILGGSDAT